MADQVNNQVNDDGMSKQQKWSMFQDFVFNVEMARSKLISSLTDPRRNINEECGYPTDVSIQMYQDEHDRNSIAARVNEVLPLETWQVSPLVYEKESASVTTPFEKEWADLPKYLQLGQKSWFKSENNNPVWRYLKRADILSGIGHYGIILIGIDDGRPLNEPVQGVELYENFDSPSPNPYVSTSVTRLGTDGQYYDTGMNPTEEGGMAGVTIPDTAPGSSSPSPKGKSKNLLYLKVFSERLAEITSFEGDRNNPRFGHPVMYNLTFNDPRENAGGIGLSLATVNVHWTRIIHIADNDYNSEVFGFPRCQQVFNEVVDAKKVRGGSAEMYWKGAFPGLSIESHPALGGDVPIDDEAMRNMMENYMNGLQRYLALLGMSAKSLAPQVVDPRPQIEVQLEAICIKLGIPLRIFKGSERGQLASEQDDANWNSRLGERQNNTVTPKIIVPFINRLIAMTILPEPTEGYKVEWPKLDSKIETAKANVALTKAKTLATYVTGGCQTAMAPVEFYTDIMEFDDAKGKQIIKAAEKYKKEHPELNPPQPGTSSPNGGSAASKGANGVGRTIAIQGDKVKHGRSPATSHLPTNPKNGISNNNNPELLTATVNQVAIDMNLTDSERDSLLKEMEGFKLDLDSGIDVVGTYGGFVDYPGDAHEEEK